MQALRVWQPARSVLQPEPRGRPEQPEHPGVQGRWGRSTVRLLQGAEVREHREQQDAGEQEPWEQPVLQGAEERERRGQPVQQDAGEQERREQPVLQDAGEREQPVQRDAGEPGRRGVQAEWGR